MKPAVYVAGTSKHCGKTSVALGLFAALRERDFEVAYMKPVGQRTVSYQGLTVDEDVALVHEVFDIDKCPSLANPVTIPSGFTREFLVEDRSCDELVNHIRQAYEQICAEAEIVVVEGTGHAGVGACLGVSNARVAKLLKCRTLIVTGGGIGRPIDEFELSRRLFEGEQVPVVGMVCNKVYPEKMDKVKQPVEVWLNQRGFKLLGMFPREPVMSELSMTQIADDLAAEVLTGRSSLPRRMNDSVVGAGAVESVRQDFSNGVLVITPGDREDLIRAAVKWDTRHGDGANGGIGVCLTSQPELSEELMAEAERAAVPIIVVPGEICEVGSKIRSWVGSILPGEEEKIAAAKSLVQGHLDLEELLSAMDV